MAVPLPSEPMPCRAVLQNRQHGKQQHTCEELGQDGAGVVDGVRLVALGQLAQGGGKAEQGLVHLAALPLPQHLRIHKQPLRARHVHKVQPGHLHDHACEDC